MNSKNSLNIRCAKENNLKEISLEIPHDKLTVVTGLSGSGKSSLAFHTAYAEGQRRYIETFSPYTRQFLDKVKKPDADLIENVRPAIAIQQRTRVTNSRSTVGTMTGVNDYLKIIWSNLAKPNCPTCGIKVRRWQANELCLELKKLSEDNSKQKYLISAPIELSNTKQIANEVERYITLGFSRFYNPKTASVESFEDANAFELTQDNKLLLILDRFSHKGFKDKRVRDSIDQAFSNSNGSCIIINSEIDAETFKAEYKKLKDIPCSKRKISSPPAVLEYKNSFSCSVGGWKLERARPALFTFNHPIGACSNCKGFGKILEIDPEKCVPDPSLSIDQGALHCWQINRARGARKKLAAFCKSQKISTSIPWNKLSDEAKDLIFNHSSREFTGIKAWFKRLEPKKYKMHIRVLLSRYRSQFECSECLGKRLKPGALAFQIDGLTLPDIWNMPVSEALNCLDGLHKRLIKNKQATEDLNEAFKAALSRLSYLVDLGLPYLSLTREARTLSGGETQRVNIAGAIGSHLVSTLFVLDEPSVGLHPRDSHKMLEAIRGLQQKGNSLLVVEHDPECIEAADHIIELGPEAGDQGGEIIFAGPANKWKGLPLKTSKPTLQKIKPKHFLKIKNATSRNLKKLNLDIPLGHFVCITGVSGSGKSTLVSQVIFKAYEKFKGAGHSKILEGEVSGFEEIDQLLIVDQSGLAKSPRANLATYSKIWDTIRNILAETDDAKERALSKSAFSFNVEGGRCPECKGAGHIKEDMQFLSDVYIECELCLGKRFQENVLEIKYNEKNVDDFLNMSVDTAANFFKDNKQVLHAAETLKTLGLGHLRLGHPLSQLSGGEAQRLKLVPFIQKSTKAKSLLIFDEPTTGLHIRDIENLLKLFQILKNNGHSVLCIEHNLQLISACDWIIDIGPEGGDRGGKLVLAGEPAEFLRAEAQGYTAKYLKEFIDRYSTKKKPVNNLKSFPQVMPKSLKIRGAKEHNLKNISLDIPLGSMLALTGVSGSGKSSIAKDIIYAEGQRRYLDCLSPYARQFIKELKKPEVDSIENIPPTICVYQHTFKPSRLSTIGTMSEVYHFMRLLYSKLGTQFCPDHPAEAITPLSAEEIAEDVKDLGKQSIRILAPIIKSKKGLHKEVFQRAINAEINEVRIDGYFDSPSKNLEGLERNKVHSIDFTIARCTPANMDQEILTEAVQSALSLGAGTISVTTDKAEWIYSRDRTCPVCKQGFFKPDPEDLSFNSRRGACKSCNGTGYDSHDEICKICEGTRLNSIGKNIRIGELNIAEAAYLTPRELLRYFTKFKFTPREAQIAEPILKEIYSKLLSLIELGLEYLPLDRDCSTLSSGELQRLRIGAAVGSPLSGVMYIFDEPSAGLHPLDNQKVLKELRALNQRGNSVIVIEHDEESILACDEITDIGPGGGRDGGEIVFTGKINEFLNKSDSQTAKALRGELESQYSSEALDSESFLHVQSGICNNIESIETKFPLHALTVVCGVSGAGKSSLVHGIIAETAGLSKSNSKQEWQYENTKLRSDEKIEQFLEIDQTPIGANSRSTPASYLKIWDNIRKLYANTIEAKSRGWDASYFSYNTGKGKCPECQGRGELKLEMSFLADAKIPCETCDGGRYSEDANSIRYLGLSISQVLDLTFEEAKTHFANHKKVHRSLHQACELGLGYLSLGQSSATLSGGESQRIKLVAELSQSRKGHTVYILDEPTTGLHKADVSRLIKMLHALKKHGHSIIVIEHDPDVIKSADQIIEMGPGPAEKGGQIIYQGGLTELLKAQTPWAKHFIALENNRSVA